MRILLVLEMKFKKMHRRKNYIEDNVFILALPNSVRALRKQVTRLGVQKHKVIMVGRKEEKNHNVSIQVSRKHRI